MTEKGRDGAADMHEIFRQIAIAVSAFIGSVWALVLVGGVVLGTGYYHNFSDQWKLNAGLAASLTALILLIFLQRSQIHSDRATHVKLDELIRATEGARDELTAAERKAAADLDELDPST